MAHATSHLYGYDCGTCGAPVHVGVTGWAHNDRRSACELVLVVEVPLARVKVADSTENLELVA